LQYWQRRLRIDSSNASLSTSNKGNDIDDDDNAIAIKATMQSQQEQQHHYGSRVTMPLLQGRQGHLDNGRDTCTSTMAKMPSS
jgi:hypothetical protein